MSTINDASRTSAAPSADGAAANGSASLRDRVRSLRLAQGGADGPGSSRAAVLLPWGVCLILLCVCAALGYYAYKIAPDRAAADLQAHTGGEAGNGQTPSAPSDSADTASSGDVVATGKGYVTPVHQVQVTPTNVAGKLVKVNPRLMEGEIFKRGDFLAQIDTEPYERERDHAAAALAGATKRKEQASSVLTSARAALQAKKDLLRRDQQLLARGEAIAESDVVQAQSDYDAQTATVRALDSGLLAAEADEAAASADLEKALLNLRYCSIVAPVDGCILAKNAELGNVVNPIAFNISSSLCNMADLADIEVEVKVQEREVAKIVKGMPCIAMPEAYSSDEAFLKIHPKGYTGHVSRLMPTADKNQGAIPVRVRLDIPPGEEGVFLKPDMSVGVRFLKQ
jgi:multidrug resistance efflux pump